MDLADVSMSVLKGKKHILIKGESGGKRKTQ